MTYNREMLLRNCLLSVINQDFDKNRYEIVVVNDGSTDDAEKVVADLMVTHKENRFVFVNHHCNKGVAEARNSGIKKSSGKLIALIADDYTIPSDYLKKTEEFFNRRSEVDVMSCRMVADGNTLFSRLNQMYFDFSVANYFKLPYIRHKIILRKIIYKKDVIKSFIAPLSGAAVTKKEIFGRFGLFNTKLRTGEDSEFGVRLARDNIPVYLNPNIKVTHNHRETLFQSLKQKFNYGKGAYWFLKFYPRSALPSMPKKILLLRYAYTQIRYAFNRCRYSNNFKEFVVSLPFMLLFATTYGLGLCYEASRPNSM